MTFVAKLGGVSTLWPKAARLRDPPPLRMFLAASLSVKIDDGQEFYKHNNFNKYVTVLWHRHRLCECSAALLQTRDELSEM